MLMHEIEFSQIKIFGHLVLTFLFLSFKLFIFGKTVDFLWEVYFVYHFPSGRDLIWFKAE